MGARSRGRETENEGIGEVARQARLGREARRDEGKAMDVRGRMKR